MRKKGLHLGSGGMILKDYLNTDLDLLDGVDIQLDISKIPYSFKDSTFENIYSSHVIEHLHKDIMPTVISEWYRLLKDKGVVVVDCPDLKEGLKRFHKNNYSWERLLSLIFGNNERPSQHHQWGWTYDTLSPLFVKCGFSQVREITGFVEYHKVNLDIPTFRLEATK